MKTFLQKNWAGLLLCLAITIPAWFLGKLVPVVGGPVFAILAGMLLTLLLKQKDQIQPGHHLHLQKKSYRLLLCCSALG